MATTPTSGPSKGERGVALLEAALALGLVSLIAAAAYSAFSQSAAATARAEARLEALAAVESALELASAPTFLAKALTDGEAILEGDGWRVRGAPYEGDDPESGGDAGPLALIRLVATSGPEAAPLVTLETLRSLPQ